MPRVAIGGAGPAGASLAYLLASRGIDVVLIERQRNFEREFRGEILMPSGIEALEQMRLREVLSRIPHHQLDHFTLYMNRRRAFELDIEADSVDGRIPLAVSQTALLEGMVEECSRFAHFTFRRGAAIRSLVRDGGRVAGVVVRDDAGESTITADVVIGADGRNSAVRRRMGVGARPMNPPMDIVWCKLPCPSDWPGVRAFAGRGHLLVAYHTWDHSLQLGWVILKGTFAALRGKGVQAWVEEMANHVTPAFAEHLRAHSTSVARPFLLESISDRVEPWSAPGVLLIGDAAHTMSPVAGQGVNIALRDAIVAANHLVPALADGARPESVDQALAAIEAERIPEIERIQNFQAMPPRLVLNRAWWAEPARHVLARVLGSARLRARAAGVARLIGFGVTDVELRV